MVVGLETRIGEPSSKFGLVCCVLLCTNAFEKDINLSLLPSYRLNSKVNWAHKLLVATSL